MSCFWDSLLNSLTKEDCIKLNLKKKTPEDLANVLKQNSYVNVLTKCQGKSLSKKQLEENKIHINNYNIDSINNGYLCSTCDPFLLLFCELLQIDIHHKYISNWIIYSNGNLRIIYLKSNKGHIEYIKEDKSIITDTSTVDKSIITDTSTVDKSIITDTSMKKYKKFKKLKKLNKKIKKMFRI